MPFDPSAQPDPYASPYAQFGNEPAPIQKQSGLGITALVMTLLSGFGIIGMFVVIAILESDNPGVAEKNSPVALAVGTGFLLLLFVGAVALCFAIASLFHRGRGKLCGVLALVLNLMMVLGVAALIALGMAMENGALAG